MRYHHSSSESWSVMLHKKRLLFETPFRHSYQVKKEPELTVKWLTEKYNIHTLATFLMWLFFLNQRILSRFFPRSTEVIHAHCNKANNSELPFSLLQPWDNLSYAPEILCSWDNLFWSLVCIIPCFINMFIQSYSNVYKQHIPVL